MVGKLCFFIVGWGKVTMDTNTMVTMGMILMETKIEMMTKEDLNNIVWVDDCPVCNGDGLDSD